MKETVTFAPPVPKTIEEAEKLMSELLKVESQVGAQEARIEAKIGEILSVLAPKVATLEEHALNIRTALTTFAKSNQNNVTFFSGDSKTLKLLSGEISIKIGNPTVTFAEGHDEASVIERVKEEGLDKKLLRFPDPELNKQAVLAGIADGTISPKIAVKLGVKREQSEAVSVKPFTLDKAKKNYEKAQKSKKAETA